MHLFDRFNKLIFIFIPVFLAGCSNTIEYKQFYDKEQKHIHFVGRVDKKNHLETGEWSYFDTLGNELSKGNMDDGFNVGKWEYCSASSKQYIDWSVSYDTSSNIFYNYPSGFIKVKGDQCLLVITNNDSASPINIVVNTLQLQSNETAEMYKNTVIETSKKTSQLLNYSYDVLKMSSGMEYYLLDFDIEQDHKLMKMYYVFKMDKSHLITEICCSSLKEKQQSAYIVFIGFYFHLIINNQRFIYSLDKIITAKKYSTLSESHL